MADTSKRTRKRQVIIEILNMHVDPAPELDLTDGTYVSYFENALGEQWVFVRSDGSDHGTVYGGDLGWEGHEVRFRTAKEIRAEFSQQGARKSMIEQLIAVANPDPLVPTLVLQSEEKAWLNTAWWTSCRAADREAELDALAEWISEQVPAEILRKHPNTTEYRAARQTLALLTGRAAGIRGMDDAAMSTLYSNVLNA